MTDQENDILWRSYYYPGTDILINNYDIKNMDELKEVEATNSFDRLLELQDNPVDLNFDQEHLRAVHQYIFDDIYPFAGKYRKANMMKNKHYFIRAEDIESYLKETFDMIEKSLSGSLDKHQFADLLARLYTDLIHCHPFREGNGRTIREFIREFSIAKSKQVGLPEMELDWKLIDKEALDEYIELAHIFPGNTAMIFEKALVSKQEKSI